MSDKLKSHGPERSRNAAFGGLLAAALVVSSGLAAAQGTAGAPAQSAPEPPGFFESIGSWFDRSVDNFNAGVRNIKDRFKNFGDEASVAAKNTVENAKGAADAVGRLPNTRVVRGHAKCQTAPNGAPDCIAAAYEICQKKGFKTGKSVDMTTAEVCPAQVYLSGRSSGSECHTETFVSRALCQ